MSLGFIVFWGKYRGYIEIMEKENGNYDSGLYRVLGS